MNKIDLKEEKSMRVKAVLSKVGAFMLGGMIFSTYVGMFLYWAVR